MTPLRYTPLRHRMLADILARAERGSGAMYRWYPATRWEDERWVRPGGVDITNSERVTLERLDAVSLLSRVNSGSDAVGEYVVPSEDGSATYSQWTSQHGDPLNPSTPEES